MLRVRDVLDARPGISEKRMFGGICFFANGNMIGGVSGKDVLILRVGPEAYEACLADEHAGPMQFTKRPMRGFVEVDPPGYEDDAGLEAWVARGLAYAESLPAKGEK